MDRIKGILQANAYGITIFLLLLIFMMSHMLTVFLLLQPFYKQEET